MSSTKKSPITIQINVTRRLLKELAAYKLELTKQSKKIEDLKSVSPPDTHMIKKQIEVLQETKDIIPDCESRLKASINALEMMLGSVDDQNEETLLANSVVMEASAQIEL